MSIGQAIDIPSSASASSSSSSSIPAVQQVAVSGDFLAGLDNAATPAQRNRRPPSRFSPSDFPGNLQSQYASPVCVGQHKRRRKLILSGAAPPPSSSSIVIQSIPAPVPPIRPAPAIGGFVCGCCGVQSAAELPLPDGELHSAPPRLTGLERAPIADPAHQHVPPRERRNAAGRFSPRAQPVRLHSVQNASDGTRLPNM